MIGVDPVAVAVAAHKAALTQAAAAFTAYQAAGPLDTPAALEDLLFVQHKAAAHAHTVFVELAKEQRQATYRAMAGGILAALVIRVVQRR